MNYHDLGDIIRISTTFTVEDVPTDPSTITLTVTQPNGSAVTYSYGSAQITRSGTGSYYKDFTTSLAGLHVYKWVGTGAASDVDEGSFTVKPSLSANPGLCSLDDVKNAMGGIRSTKEDALYVELIATASSLIQDEYEREFTPLSSATRTFRVTDRLINLAPYDLRTITSVTLNPGGSDELALTSSQYVAHPISKKEGVWSTLQIANSVDVQSEHASEFGYGLIAIEGDWGFPTIPAAVSRACVLTVLSWVRADPSQYQNAGDADSVLPVVQGTYAIPASARRLLDTYRRWAMVV